jgi:hypothetical protein
MESILIGEGPTLYVEIEDLEKKLGRKTLASDEANVDYLTRGKI